MIDIKLPAGEKLFDLPCEVRLPGCQETPSLIVSLLADNDEQGCCQPCLSQMTSQGTWQLAQAWQAIEPGDFRARLSLNDAEARLLHLARLVRAGRDSRETLLSLQRTSEGLAVAFHGWRDVNILEDILRALASEAIAPHLLAFRLSGEEAGANGTREWNLKPLIQGADFPRLELLEIEGNKPGAHNRSIVGELYEERGQLAQALGRMPQLKTLSTPSAPDASFFQRSPHPLRRLIMQTGYAHQGCIAALAQATCFASLERFDFTDYAETYEKRWEEKRTPRDAFEALFMSRQLPALRELTLRGTCLQPDEAARWRQTPLGQQLEQLLLPPL